MLEEPASEEVSIMSYPHFVWSKVASSIEYRIEIGSDTSFLNIIDSDNINSIVNWYVIDKPLAPGTYFWRVQAYAEGGAKGPWSEVRMFQVSTPAKIYHITPSMTVKEIQKIGEEASRSRSAMIRFEKGDYQLDLAENEPLFRWRGADQIIIDGGGSSFFRNPSSPFVELIQCRRIMIGNLSLGNEPFDASLVKVLSINPDAGTIDAEILDGFDGINYPWEVNQMFCYAVDPSNPLKKHAARPGHTYLAWGKTEDLGQLRRRFHVNSASEIGSLKALQIGDKILVNYRRWALNIVKQCEDITFYRFTGLTPESGLFLGGGNKDMKFLNNASGSLKGIFPGAGTWVTGNDRRGPWIEGCSWEAPPDDGPNITGNCYLIQKIISPNSFQIKTGPSYQNAIWQPGDDVLFWNSNTGLPLQETTVLEAKEQPDHSIIVTLRDPVESVVPMADPTNLDCRVGTHVYNLSCQNSQTVIRNNSIKGGRRFGFNIKAINALIEKNYFEDLASSALYLENEPSGWEGVLNRNIVIQDNVIKGCGGDADSIRRPRANIHINLWRNASKNETPWQGHQNIVIRRNTITNREGVGIAVDNATDVLIADNIITNQQNKSSQSSDPRLSAAIHVFPHTQRVTVRDNHVSAKEPELEAIIMTPNPQVP